MGFPPNKYRQVPCHMIRQWSSDVRTNMRSEKPSTYLHAYCFEEWRPETVLKFPNGITEQW